MSQIEQTLSGPWAVRLGWTLVYSLWEIAVVAVIVASLLALLRHRSANLWYLVACVGLAAMLVPPLVTYSLLPTEPDTIEPPIAMPAAVANESPVPLPPLSRFAAEPPPASPLFVPAETSDAAPADASPPAATATSPPQAASPAASRWVPWLAACWILGVLALSIRNLGGWFAAWRLRRCGTVPMPEPWHRRFSDLKTRLRVGLPVRLVKSVLVEVPVVVGWLRPVILMPVGILTGFAPQEIEAMLAHELAHVRRLDCLVNLLQTVAETLLFYHPAAWWLSRRIRIERENCCDDAAVAVCGSRPLYARTLTALVARCGAPRAAVAADGGNLVARVRRILGKSSPSGGRPAAWLAGLVVLVSLTVLSVGLYASAQAGSASDSSHTETAVAPAAEPESRGDAQQAPRAEATGIGQDSVNKAERTEGGAERKPAPSSEDENAKALRWVVTGKVTDPSGNGLPGVSVRANCGWGTLRPTGETTTAADGTYTLRFSPGMHVLDEKTNKWRAGVQTAVVSPSNPGYYEWNLHRQGDLLMADKLPDEKELKVWGARPDRIVLPNHPHPVDFVMAPAASIDVLLVDDKNGPLADTPLQIAGETLPPASSVLTSGRTDKSGKYAFGEVPLEYAWSLVVPQPGNPIREVRTLPIVFREPGLYRILLHGDLGSNTWSPTFLRVPTTGPAGPRGEAVLVDPARTFIAALTSAEVKLPLTSETHYGFSQRVRRVLSSPNLVTFDKDGNVTAMSLSEPWIDDDVVREFQVLPKLEQLSLTGRAEIGDRALASLGRLAELKSLTVSGHKVTDQGLTYMANLQNLRSLFLWSNRITDEGLAHLASAKKLESLYLWSDRITDEGLKTVSRIQHLKNLGFLGGAHVTEAGLQHLAGMKRLKSLRIDYATVPWAAIDPLKQALPGCEILVTSKE